MSIFTKNDKKVLELTEAVKEEKRKQVSDCQQEVSEILKKHNCSLRINQSIIIIPNQ